ncbi:MAG: OB-fold domain-containing protein [Acidimicrobiales bacterium]
MSTTAVPAVEGWFTTDAEPHLLGTRCTTCGTVFFPRASGFCRNPDCRGRAFDEVELSRTGTVWSYTDAQYQPPPPYIPSGETHEPFAIAAVELAAEQMVILGQVATGYGVDDLSVGSQVELVVEPLYDLDGVTNLIYRWKPVEA